MKQPLSTDACQQIYYEALRVLLNDRYATGKRSSPIIEDNELEFRKKIDLENHVFHPDQVPLIYEGVTLDMFRHIEELYCSRIGRSVSMVANLVNLRREDLRLPSISDLAIWTICVFLQEKHDDSVAVSIDFVNANWMIETMDWRLSIMRKGVDLFQPSAACVIDIDRQHILYLKLCKREELKTAATIALYEAMLSQRDPSMNAKAALKWQLPQKIYSIIELDSKVKLFLEKIHIDFQYTQDRQIVINKLLGNWEKDLENRVIPERNFSLILDNFMSKNFGHAPLAYRKELENRYKGLSGFSHDPLWQFPDLRLLFDRVSIEVNINGVLKVGSLKYTHDLLLLFRNRVVDVLVSPTDQSSAWIYDQGGRVICQAKSI